VPGKVNKSDDTGKESGYQAHDCSLHLGRKNAQIKAKSLNYGEGEAELTKSGRLLPLEEEEVVCH
jgi:hypothetical protein